MYTFKSILGVALATTLVGSASASIIDINWIGPNAGLWHNTSHWDPDTIPNNGSGFEYHAIISTRFGTLVNLGSSATISELTIGDSDHLRIANNNSLTLSASARSGGVINNAGLLELASIGNNTNLYMAGGEITLTGGGIVQLNNTTSHIRRSGAVGSLLNVDNTIRGSGNLSGTTTSTRMDITNQHLIIADAATPMRIFPTSAHLFTNEGTLRSQNGAILELNAGPYLNDGGLIEALAGSQVSLSGDAEITGGELTTEGNGVIRVTGSTPRLTDVILSGSLIVNNNNSLDLEGAIENSGTIELASIGNNTALNMTEGPVTLTGGGTIFLNSVAHIRRNGGEGSLVNVDNTIRGRGQLSGTTTSNRMDITNQHLIIADIDGGTLNIDPTSTQLFTNEGTLLAQDGGILRLNAGPYLNDGGMIEALAGSQVSLHGAAEITGGELTTEGNGVIRVTGSTPRLTDVILSGSLILNNFTSLDLEGAIENSGTIELASIGNTTALNMTEGPVTLTGGGTIFLNSVAHLRRSGGEGSLVNVDNTIRGRGQLSGTTTSNRMDITNQHLIIADVDGGTLDIDPTVTQLFTNEGTLRAQDGGILSLNTGPYLNDGGMIEALAGSQVSLSGAAEITGGEITTEDDGVIRVTSGTPRLTDVILSGSLIVNNNNSLDLEGAIENSGTIELASIGNNTALNMKEGPVTLTGGGTIFLNSVAHIRRNSGDGSLVNVDNTIRGVGNLSGTTTSNRMDITNQGTILADSDSGALTIYGNNSGVGFTNATGGLVHVTGLGGLTSSQDGFTNAGGQITVDAGRSLSRSGHYDQTAGTTTVNGTLAVTGSGNQLRLQGGVLNGNGQINGVLNNTDGFINPGASTGQLIVNGTYMQSNLGILQIEINGEMPIDEHDVIHVNGNAMLGGGLEPIFDENYTPAVGDEWTVLTASSRSGTFAVMPCNGIRVRYESDDDGELVTIEYTGVNRVGDLNCDGIVNVSDLLLLLGAWGNCPANALCPGDLNDDGVVNVSDLLILLGNWG